MMQILKLLGGKKEFRGLGRIEKKCAIYFYYFKKFVFTTQWNFHIKERLYLYFTIIRWYV